MTEVLVPPSPMTDGSKKPMSNRVNSKTTWPLKEAVLLAVLYCSCCLDYVYFCLLHPFGYLSPYLSVSPFQLSFTLPFYAYTYNLSFLILQSHHFILSLLFSKYFFLATIPDEGLSPKRRIIKFFSLNLSDKHRRKKLKFATNSFTLLRSSGNAFFKFTYSLNALNAFFKFTYFALGSLIF